MLNPLLAELRAMFSNIQLGIDKLGTEKIIHSIRCIIQQDPTIDVFIMDGENAFNQVSRIEILLLVKELFPEEFEFFQSYLSVESSMWCMNKESPIQPIQSCEGVVQGDVAGSALYSLGVHPLNKQIRHILITGNNKSNVGVNFSFIDDNILAAHTNKMIEGVNHFLINGKKYGWILNRMKKFI